MPVTPGIDVSDHQGAVNWEMVADANYRFAVIRASVGDYYPDPRFQENWDGAQNAGLIVSAYHVVRPDIAPAAQVARFLGVLGNRKSDLPLVLDVELDKGLSPAAITASVKACLQEIEQRDARKPIIYTARWFWNPHMSGSSSSRASGQRWRRAATGTDEASRARSRMRVSRRAS